jgi:hypothetical protein
MADGCWASARSAAATSDAPGETGGAADAVVAVAASPPPASAMVAASAIAVLTDFLPIN